MLFKLPGKKNLGRSDEELLDEYTQSADMEVLGELYSRYMHLVYGVCLKYLKERDEAMDAVMQIFEKLVIEIPRQKIENFSGWLHVVARNFCLMQLRSRKTREERFKEWINDPVLFMENAPFMHPVDENKPDLENGLMDCIEKLKNEQKECIRQFYFNNRCYLEIAGYLNIDEKKVKSHLQNAKRNLKICLEEKHVREEKEY